MRTLSVYVFACDPPCKGPVIVAAYSEGKAKDSKFPQKAGDATCMRCGKLYKATKETPMYLIGSVDWPK